MKIALCNEILQPMPFAMQCDFARQIGYDGLELAPFTFADEPHLMIPAERTAIRRTAREAGIEITGLNRLLLTPRGLSITSPDDAVRSRTVDVLMRLVDLCHDLGGKVMVHGSPAQRSITPGDTREAALARAKDCFARVGTYAATAEVAYCIEPLARTGTQIVNTVAEAVEIVDEIGSPGLRAMIDTGAAGRGEREPVAALIDRWLPSGRVAHIQVSDTNRRGPGEGDDRFGPVFAALVRNRYEGVVAVEAHKYLPDGQATAARAAGYIRGVLEGLRAMQGIEG
ncbi:MAG: sugar phosphate isomerase/epimerase [Burkholderiales bacterium]|nr:sugar phosphate isomerase/epimerase [Burkholderiales bacterium]